MAKKACLRSFVEAVLYTGHCPIDSTNANGK